MKPLSIRSGLLLAIAAACLLIGCDRTAKYQGVDMSSSNSVPMSGVCVGQFELQLPATGQKEWDVDFDWAKVSRLPLDLHTEQDFWKFVEHRRNQLAATKHNKFPSLLEHYEKVGDHAALLLQWDDPRNRDVLYLERYLWLGDRGYFFKGLGEGDEIKGKLEGYKQVFSKLAPLTGNEKQHGFCIDGALVSLDLPEISVGLSVRPNGLSNTSFYVGIIEFTSINDSLGYPEEDPRFAGALGAMKEDHELFKGMQRDPYLKNEPATPKEFKVLREGQRTVAGRLGDEAIWQKTLNNGVKINEFRWFLLGKKPRLHDNPGLSLELSSGDEMKPDDKAVPEEQLIALWDAVLDSAKKR